MSEEERKNVCTIISSILTSSTKKMTIQQLNRDYMDTVGYRIPHGKFGCTNVEQFLRTLTDKIQIHGSGMHAEVQVLISSKTAHINKLISKQRAPKGKPSKAFNRGYRPPPPRRSFIQYTNDRNYNNNNMTNQNRGAGDATIPNETSCISSNINTTLNVKEEFRGAIPKQFTQQSNDVEEIYFSDEDNRRNLRVPYNIQENLKRLIMMYPDGIMCSSILEYYRKEYGRSLSYSEYGYRSVAEMCVDLRDIFKVVQLDKSDIKLFSKDLTIPEDTLNTIKKFQLMKIKASRETPSDSAIPNSGIDDLMCEIYTNNPPVDIVEFGVELERQWISPDMNEQDYIDVNVGEVYDPSKFWMNLRMYANKLNELMDNLQIFYATHNKELHVPNFAMRNNMYVVCMFDREYHRARIVDTSQKGENYIKVYFVDYGTVSVISVESVCYLHNKFSELPEQAIRARLAGIYPAKENEQWSRAAATRFLSLVMQKDLVAQIVKIDEERKILDVVLADTSDEEDFYLNDALVSMGYALFTFEKREPAIPSKIIPIVRYIHLFPTHVELENGSVPTATQSICMHQAGMTVEQMYPHYFKDAETGKSISMLEASSGKTSHLTVDYESEQAYFDMDNERVNTEEDNPISLESATNFAGSTYRWEDMIEQVELNSTVESGCNTEICFQDNAEESYSPTDTDATLCYTSPKQSPRELQEDKGTQTQRSISIQTDEKRNPPNINTSDAAVKKPLRPPPGYDHIIPHNTTVTYNYNTSPQHEHPHRHVTNQTYINFPVMYPYQAQQYGYNPYQNPYWLSLQHMMQLGNKLSPEQQNYLQSLSGNNALYSGYNPYYNRYNIQPNYPYQSPYVAAGYPNQNYANMQHPQNYQNVAQPENVTSNLQPNPEVVPTNLEVESIPLPIGPCKYETGKDDVKTGDVSNELLQENKLETDADNVCEKNVIETETESQIEQIESSPLPQAVQEADTKTELNLRIDNEEPPTSDAVSINCDASELESVYEDCTSNDSVKEESTTILQEDITYKTKLITSMSINDLNLHVINHDNEYYFLLAELSKTLFGKTLTAFHVRKLMVGTPYIISVVDIRLKTNPKLKNELLMYDLISENEVVVDAIPIKYLKDLTTMVTATEEDVDHINDLLKGVDYFLTELSLENAGC